MEIGKILKQQREKNGFSMNALAKKASVTQSSISDIEAGKRQPSFDLIDRIVTALDLTLSEFFSEDEPELRPALRELLSTTETLPDDKVQALITAAKAMK